MAGEVLPAGVPVLPKFVQGEQNNNFAKSKMPVAEHTSTGILPALREGPLPPVIILFTHCYFGSGEAVPAPAGLCGVFAAYPGQKPKAPALAPACAQHLTLTSASLSGGLAGRLAALFAG